MVSTQEEGPRPRVLLVTNGFPPSASAGVESHSHALARHLQPAHEVHVFCREAGYTHPEYTVLQGDVDGIPVTRVVNNLRDVYDYEALYRNARVDALFAETLRRVQPDIIHVQHCVGLSVGCLEQALDSGKSVVVTLHDFWFICPTVNLLRRDGAACAGTHHGANCFDCVRLVPRQLEDISKLPAYFTLLHRVYPERLRQPTLDVLAHLRARQERGTSPAIAARVATMRALLARAAHILTPSQHVKDVYVEFGLSPERIQVLPLGMDVAHWLEAARPARPAAAPLHLGFVGSFLPIKGVDVLVRAFRQVPGAMQLDLCGFEPPESLYPAQLRALAAGDPRIRYEGPIPNAALAARFAGWDALVLPTVSGETFSFVAREALLAGLPVIASNKPVLPELVRDGENGFLLPAGDVGAWAAALATLRDHPQRLRAMRPRASTDFARTFEQNAAAHAALYAALIGTPHTVTA